MGQKRTRMTVKRGVGYQRSSPRRGGFTLTELLVVIVIIGIIITLILTAAQNARVVAQEASTQSLIQRLETAINDRLDALLQSRPDANWAHFYMSAIYTNTGQIIPQPPQLSLISTYPPATQRAQVIAWYDFIKSEMPDVFVVQGPPLSYSNPQSNNYPLNFAANPYPGTAIVPQGNFILPLGNSVNNNPPPPLGNGTDYGAGNNANTVGTGIYGASYNAAAAIYKNLGYLPAGYDGVDNNYNGLIDDSAEGVTPPGSSNPDQATVNLVNSHLANHLHHTARSETLYAILVEGVGPLGSIFSRDDFTENEVKDTDGDGLPEFVDAWGQPLQFFRWPILYHSDTQKGQVIDFWDFTKIPPASSANEQLNPPYRTVFESREQDPLDPNQQLVAPMWWSAPGGNSNSPFVNISGGGWLATTAGAPPASASGGVVAFEYFFHRLTEPFGHTGASPYYWDRGSIVPYRRAFYSRPLILSGGPDLQPGVYLYLDTPSPPPTASQLLAVENNAMTYVFDFTSNLAVQPGGANLPYGPFISPDPSPTNTSYPSYLLRESGRDDISNQNRQSTGGIGGS